MTVHCMRRQTGLLVRHIELSKFSVFAHAVLGAISRTVTHSCR